MAVPTYQELVDEIMDIVRDATWDVPAVAAQGKITISGGLPSAEDTITIHSDTWTFKSSRSTTGEITIGATADACVTNIATAINADSEVVTASANTTDDTVTVTSVYKGRSFGAAGRSWDGMVFSESASNLSMDGSGYLGGTTAGVYGDRAKKMVNDGLIYIAGQVNLPELETFCDLICGNIYVLGDGISFDADNFKIEDEDSGFTSFVAGMSIVICGADNAENNQVTSVSTVASDYSYITVPCILEDEDAGETIAIAADCVALPSDFQKPIRRAYNLTLSTPINFHSSLNAMLQHYHPINQRGSVYSVAIKGQYLHYQHIPYTIDSDIDSREMVRIPYYQFPTQLDAMEDQPDCFPAEVEHLVKPLLVSYGVKEILKRVFKADVQGGGHQVIAMYEGEFIKSLHDLKVFLGPDDKGYDGFKA